MNLKDVTSDKWELIKDHGEKLPQGYNLWYRGIPYPRRVYYNKLRDDNFFLRTLEALGAVKKFLFALTHLKGLVIPITFKVKKWETFFLYVYQQCYWILAEFMIADEEFSVPVWEIGKFIHRFLWELGFSMQLAGMYARLVMMILEFDNAYRYRVQDLFGAVSFGLWLYHPKEWVRQALKIYQQRELLHKDDPNWGARGRILKLKLLLWILWIPKVKKAWMKAARSVVYRDILFTDSDRFHFAFWVGYDFEGKTFDERFSPYEFIYMQAPFRRRQDPQIITDFMLGK